MAKWLQVTLAPDDEGTPGTTELINFDKVERIYKHSTDPEGVITLETDSNTIEIMGTIEKLYHAIGAAVIA